MASNPRRSLTNFQAGGSGASSSSPAKKFLVSPLHSHHAYATRFFRQDPTQGSFFQALLERQPQQSCWQVAKALPHFGNFFRLLPRLFRRLLLQDRLHSLLRQERYAHRVIRHVSELVEGGNWDSFCDGSLALPFFASPCLQCTSHNLSPLKLTPLPSLLCYHDAYHSSRDC